MGDALDRLQLLTWRITMKHSQYCVVSGLLFGFILPAVLAFWAFRLCRN